MHEASLKNSADRRRSETLGTAFDSVVSLNCWRRCHNLNLVGRNKQQNDVSLLCQYCPEPEVGFPNLQFHPFANRHDDYFSATPVSG